MAKAGAGHGHRSIVINDGVTSPDYTESFAIEIGHDDRRSPEQWARAVFEDAPLPVRWFLLLGWKAGLGLRLGPQSSPEYILGWRIAAAECDAIRLELQSALMTAVLVLRVDGSTASLTTSVCYKRRAARPLWAVARPIHKRMVPYLLSRAASRS